MNCLKCPNFWKSEIDETACDKCGCEENGEKEEKSDG